MLESSSQKPVSASAWLRLVGVLSVGLVLDQYTKALAHTHLRGRPFVPLVEGYVELRYSLNRGAFFSIGADLSDPFRTWLLSGLAGVTLVLVLLMYARTQPAQARLRWGLSLLLAGGAGNLVDRARRGEVIDFLHVHVRDLFHWATFNLADVYLTAGIGLLIIDLLRPQTASSAHVTGATTHNESEAS